MGKGFVMDRDCLEYSYQKYDNPLIREIRMLHQYRDNDEKGDCCEVIFQDGSSVIHKLNISSVYVSIYGVPLSADGSVMFVGDWNNGLIALDTRSGKELWRLKKRHIRSTLIFSDYGVTVQSEKALIQFDPQTGAILNTINGGLIDKMYFLKDELVLIYRHKGSACIVDCRSMRVVKRIDPRILDPYECLSFCLLNVHIENNQVIATGWESGSRAEKKFKPKHNFERVIHVFDSTVFK